MWTYLRLVKKQKTQDYAKFRLSSHDSEIVGELISYLTFLFTNKIPIAQP